MLRRHQLPRDSRPHHRHRRQLSEGLASPTQHQLRAEDPLLMWGKLAQAIFLTLALAPNPPTPVLAAALWGRLSTCGRLSIGPLAMQPKLPQLASYPPNTPVILISIDTLRADRLSCYGYKKIRTPHFDSLTSGGTIFTAVDSPVPMTLPAHTSLLTSTYPFFHGVEENGQPVRPGAVTLAGVLKSHGYQTAAFIGSYVLDAAFGLNQGFDLYDSPFRIRPQP